MPSRSPVAARLKLGVGTLCIGALLAGGASLLLRRDAPSVEGSLQDAQTAFDVGDFETAERFARRALASDAENLKAQSLAVRSAVGSGRLEAVVDEFDRLTEADRDDLSRALAENGSRLLREGRLSAAERFFRSVLRLDEHHLEANDRLAYLLRLTGRYRQAAPLHEELLRQNRWSVDVLIALAHGDAVALNGPTVEWLEECRRETPGDPIPCAALARDALFKNQPDRARKLAAHAVGLDGRFVWAHVLLGRALIDAGTEEDLRDWNRRLPRSAIADAGVWFVRGSWARRIGDWPGAARCFGEVLRRDPDSRPANFQLLQVLQRANADELATLAAERVRSLDGLARLVKAFHADRDNPDTVGELARWMETEGRIAEARAWFRLALLIDPRATWAAESLDRLELDGLEDVREDRATGHSLDRLIAGATRYELPSWDERSAGSAQGIDASAGSDTTIAFFDSAGEAGLDFRYVNGGDPRKGILHMQESNGGGAAVIDYDLDAWPDLYFAQGGAWPPNEDENPHLDRLFRNSADGRFDDVTEQAGIREAGFSQGVTAGDLDNDGFPDLYVGNIGANKLFRNNGDGTFTDASDQIELDRRSWTTSCLMADLDGDALPDLYAVNYLSGDDVFTRVCRGADGEPAACTPDVFSGAADEAFLNLGDGGFQAQGESAGVGLPDGKGLGVVAADLDGTGRLNLFVANDQVRNFYFVNRSKPGRLSFDEQGVLSGLAFDRDGNAQACMGIAVDDLDRDGCLDLFVTNFYNESNTLYSQQPFGGFADTTVTAGLRDPSFALLGFGTQFCDADLDGDPDLVIANGHVTQTRNVPYRMRPQFLRNDSGRFLEVRSEHLGGYFRGEYLGRALATLDWNRDGRTDCVVTHLDAPAALLTNRTRDAGRFLRLKLCGVRSARDAIGAIVQVRSGDVTWTRQLTAGDGFQACNQKQLVLGLGKRDHVDHVEIRWPSGVRQSLRDLEPDVEYLVIEGRGTVTCPTFRTNRYESPG